MQIGTVSFLVRDYDEAISYFTHKLGFIVCEDTPISKYKRWVTVSSGKESSFKLLLAKAKNSEEESRIGNQTGGRVFLFLETDNFDSDYSRLKENGTEFIEAVRSENYGRVVVFKDLYGNTWDLIETKR